MANSCRQNVLSMVAVLIQAYLPRLHELSPLYQKDLLLSTHLLFD